MSFVFRLLFVTLGKNVYPWFSSRFHSLITVSNSNLCEFSAVVPIFLKLLSSLKAYFGGITFKDIRMVCLIIDLVIVPKLTFPLKELRIYSTNLIILVITMSVFIQEMISWHHTRIQIQDWLRELSLFLVDSLTKIRQEQNKNSQIGNKLYQSNLYFICEI